MEYINLNRHFEHFLHSFGLIKNQPANDFISALSDRLDKRFFQPTSQFATPGLVSISNGTVQLGAENSLMPVNPAVMDELSQLKPWRKGPFSIGDIHIDAEWDCDQKWRRFSAAIGDLAGKQVLDVGANNGYYLFRLLAAGAHRLLGVDPHPLYFRQFLFLNQWANTENLFFLPIGYDELNHLEVTFDLVLLMGILYHEKNPLGCLATMQNLLAPGGQIIVESIVIDAPDDFVLFPKERYAKMKNVYFVPTVKALENWLVREKFQNIQLIDLSPTTSQEQRVTNWSGQQSLADFLDPNDQTRTIEGYPAPKRAIFLARGRA